MRIPIRLLSIALSLLAPFAAARAAVAPASAIPKTDLTAADRELVRSELSTWFRNVEKNSPTVLGGLARSPESMAAIQKRIAGMGDADLARFRTMMAESPDWKVAPEAFAGAFPPEVLDQVRRVGASYAEELPKGEILREDVRALAQVLKLVPDSKLAELGIDRKMVDSLEQTFDGMTPLQATMLRQHAMGGAWREQTATALQAFPPALRRGAAALAEHGPLTDDDVTALHAFRDELIGLMSRIEKLSPEARRNLKGLNADGLRAEIARLEKAPPDILFMVRHNMPRETLQSLRTNIEFLEKISSFDAGETAELERFRGELANAFRQVHGQGEEEWADVDAMLAGLGPQHLFVLKQRMDSLGGWQTALPAVYQTLADPRTSERLRMLQGAAPDPVAAASLESFRLQALGYIDAVRSTPGLDAALVTKARTIVETAPLDRLELIRLADARLPASASPSERLSVVSLHEINFNCSLSMTAIPEVCFPEVCFGELGCTPAYCTPAVTVTASFDVVCNPIEDALETVEHSITSTANAAVATMRSQIEAALASVESSINSSIAAVNSVIDTSVAFITDTVDDIWAFVQTIPDLAWSAIKEALNALLDIEIRNGVTVRDLVAEGAEQALTSMKTLLGLSQGWWNAVSTFTLPAIPCPPAGFHTPFGDVGDGAAAANYARYRLMIDGIINMIPDTETSLAVKVPAQVTYMLFDFLGLCLEQAAAEADAAESLGRHELVLANFANMQIFVSSQIAGLTASSNSQTTSLLTLLTNQNAATQSTVVAESQAIQSLINSQTSSTQTLVENESEEIQTLLRNEGEDTRDQMGDFRALTLRMTIEQVLQAGVSDEIGSLQLVAPWGHLSEVRKIVEETIESMTIAQEGIGQARKYFDGGVQLMDAGKYKEAFRQFINAYRETTK
jgi:hypothetical protein